MADTIGRMSGEVIDQDGTQQVWQAHYWQHHSECWEECSSPEEAIAFLNYGMEAGNLAASGVIWPDGTERKYDWVHDPDGKQMLAREQTAPKQLPSPDGRDL